MRIACGNRSVLVDGWPQPGIWFSDNDAAQVELVPMVAPFGGAGTPAGMRMMRWMIEAGILPTPAKTTRLEVSRALANLMISIPERLRVLVAPADEFQWRVIRLLAVEREVENFLNTADGGRSWHYVLAALSFTSKDMDANVFARNLMNQPRRQFLAELSGIELPRIVFEIFARLPRRCCGAQTYRWILEAAKTRQCDDIISELVAPEAPLRPMFRHVAHYDPRREIMSFLQPPPFSMPALLEPLMSPAALAKEGEAMHNCVASRAERVQAGGYCVYRWLGAERATVAFTRRRDGSWKIAEVKAFANSSVKPETRREIELALAQLSIN